MAGSVAASGLDYEASLERASEMFSVTLIFASDLLHPCSLPFIG
jgi:hypothetical protein